MLQLLTNYLLQYRTVAIPHVGTIKLLQQPAQADVVHQQVLPPRDVAQLQSDDEVTKHQLNYLAASMKKTHEAAMVELKAFGSRLYDAMNGPGFEWQGIGRFDRSTTSVLVEVAGLQAVEAQKLIRENPNHIILVGDRETTSLQLADEKDETVATGHKRSELIIIAWVLLVLSIIAAAFLLYSGKFTVGAAGSRWKSAWVKSSAADIVHFP